MGSFFLSLRRSCIELRLLRSFCAQLRRITPSALVLCTVTPLRHNLNAVVRHTVFRSARAIVTQIAVHAKSRVIRFLSL